MSFGSAAQLKVNAVATGQQQQEHHVMADAQTMASVSPSMLPRSATISEYK